MVEKWPKPVLKPEVDVERDLMEQLILHELEMCQRRNDRIVNCRQPVGHAR